MAIMCNTVTFVCKRPLSSKPSSSHQPRTDSPIDDCGHKLLCRTGCHRRNPDLCPDVLNTRTRRYYECYLCIERINLENKRLEEQSKQQFEERLHMYQKSAEELDQDMEGCVIGEAK
jgi:hypothetical protein